jgi:N-acetylglutamate synthase-like GNAT family acetyltransferase
MIEIVPFSTGFQAAVVELILPIQREEFGFPVTVEDQLDLVAIPGFYQFGAGWFSLALDGPQVVGTIGLRDIGGHQGALRKMFVNATHGGKEHLFAASLLAHLVEDAYRKEILEVFLGTTERFLAAHRFYEKNGFRRVADSELPPTFPRMALDARFDDTSPWLERASTSNVSYPYRMHSILPAVPADATVILGIQMRAFAEEGRLSGSMQIPPLTEAARPFMASMFVCYLGVGVVAACYFFFLPVATAAAICLCIAWAWWLGQRKRHVA